MILSRKKMTTNSRGFRTCLNTCIDDCLCKGALSGLFNQAWNPIKLRWRQSRNEIHPASNQTIVTRVINYFANSLTKQSSQKHVTYQSINETNKQLSLLTQVSFTNRFSKSIRQNWLSPIRHVTVNKSSEQTLWSTSRQPKTVALANRIFRTLLRTPASIWRNQPRTHPEVQASNPATRSTSEMSLNLTRIETQNLSWTTTVALNSDTGLPSLTERIRPQQKLRRTSKILGSYTRVPTPPKPNQSAKSHSVPAERLIDFSNASSKASRRFEYDVTEEELVYRHNLQRQVDHNKEQPTQPADKPSASTQSLATSNSTTARTALRPVPASELEPALLEKLTRDIIRRVEQRMRIERQRRGL